MPDKPMPDKTNKQPHLASQSLAKQSSEPAPSQRGILRWVLLGCVAIVIGLVFYFDLASYISLDRLREHRSDLLSFVEQNYIVSIVLALSIYALAVAVSLPGGALMSVTIGFIFGPWVGTALVVVAATCGASGVFLLAKGILGDRFLASLGSWMTKLADGFNRNAFNYILALRLIPLVPFSVLNPIPAFFGVSLPTYALATFIGIIPGSYVFVSLGEGLGSVLDQGGDLDFRSVFTPQLLIALAGLAVLALIPVVYRLYKNRSSGL